MSENCQKLAFTNQIVVLKSGLKNNWMKKLDRVNRPLDKQIGMEPSVIDWAKEEAKIPRICRDIHFYC